jgi:hypothetical protein
MHTHKNLESGLFKSALIKGLYRIYCGKSLLEKLLILILLLSQFQISGEA